ncbi:MAG TPA: hypothetical protein VL460_11625 [Caulobacteraceae bacterium]|jgi:hypothetical protein|nr:hypothetical protein [Caulobacteraceae bacterium]
MSSVVHLKWGEDPPSGDRYLLVTRQGRIRGDDFYISPSSRLQTAVVMERAFASLNSALTAAQAEAQLQGVETIYVRMA